MRVIVQSAERRKKHNETNTCGNEVGVVKEITEQDFDKEVLEGKLPVFACFTTEWCHSCYPTCLLADELSNEYEGRVKFVKIDVGKIPHVSAGYRIVAVPTILIFKDAQPVKTLLGFQNRSSLRRLLNSVTGENNTAVTGRVPRSSSSSLQRRLK